MEDACDCRKIDSSKEKYIYLEVLRIISIFFVIFNHTGKSGFFLFSIQPADSLQFWIYLFLSIFCKCSVPIFFAISGAIMLGRKDEPLKDIWKKRILKIFIILIIISLLYYIVDINFNFSKFKINEFFNKLYTDKEVRAFMWYLYAYIAYLISLPFLRALVKNLENKYYYYMIVIALIFNGIIPVAEYLLGEGITKINSNIRVSWLTEKIVLYPCIGYFLHNKFEINKHKRVIPLLWEVNFLGIAISSYMTYYKGQITGILTESKSQGFYNSFVLINCISIFVTIKYIFKHIKISDKLTKLFLTLGECTFGVYLLHSLVNARHIREICLENMKNIGIEPMISAILWCLLVTIATYIIVWILKKIPGIKKLVGG